MTQALADVLKQADALLPTEQMLLIAYLAERNRSAIDDRIAGSPPPPWSAMRGIAPDLLADGDAQAWVSQTRREAQDRRELP